jgi:hypothetical protein
LVPAAFRRMADMQYSLTELVFIISFHLIPELCHARDDKSFVFLVRHD